MTAQTCRCGRPIPDTGCCVLCPTLQPNRRPAHPEPDHDGNTPPACHTCRTRLAALPHDIADAHTWLHQLLEPRRGATQTRTTTAEAPIPLAVDPYDLTAPHTTPQGPIRRGRLAAHANDQIGHLPVAVTLAMWIRDWADIRDQGEAADLEHWTVYALSLWLAERTDWAVDNHPAIDEYAGEMVELRGALLALVGQEKADQRPERIVGVPCIRCRHVTLVRRDDGSVECGWPDCASVWRADEYERWTRAAANAARRGKTKPAHVA